MELRTDPPTRSAPAPLPGEPRRVLVATDLGPVGDAAMQAALARARPARARLAVCYALSARPDGAPESTTRAAAVERQVRATLRDLAGPTTEELAEVITPVGEPGRLVQACATAWRAELLVVGRPEPGGVLSSMFRPAVVERLVRAAPCSVLVTRRCRGAAHGPIVVGTDLSAPALPALRAAAREQQRSGAAAWVVHLEPPPALPPPSEPAALAASAPRCEAPRGEALAALARACDEAGLRAEPWTSAEAPGPVEAAQRLGAGLVIVGTHGPAAGGGGLPRLAFGSLAQQLVEKAPCPVMIVRQVATS